MCNSSSCVDPSVCLSPSSMLFKIPQPRNRNPSCYTGFNHTSVHQNKRVRPSFRTHHFAYSTIIQGEIDWRRARNNNFFTSLTLNRPLCYVATKTNHILSKGRDLHLFSKGEACFLDLTTAAAMFLSKYIYDLQRDSSAGMFSRVCQKSL